MTQRRRRSRKKKKKKTKHQKDFEAYPEGFKCRAPPEHQHTAKCDYAYSGYRARHRHEQSKHPGLDLTTPGGVSSTAEKKYKCRYPETGCIPVDGVSVGLGGITAQHDREGHRPKCNVICSIHTYTFMPQSFALF